MDRERKQILGRKHGASGGEGLADELDDIVSESEAVVDGGIGVDEGGQWGWVDGAMVTSRVPHDSERNIVAYREGAGPVDERCIR
jgi:hypothetical protein